MTRSTEQDQEVAAIVSRIGLLFEKTHTGSPPAASELEEALADGYACLLALQVNRARIARRSAELFASQDTIPSVARELRSLNALLLARDVDILRLRSLLAELQDHLVQTALAG